MHCGPGRNHSPTVHSGWCGQRLSEPDGKTMNPKAEQILRELHLLDAGVVAEGAARGWLSPDAVLGFASAALEGGNLRDEVVELALREYQGTQHTVGILHRWASDLGLPSASAVEATRRWMFAALTAIVESADGPEHTLDAIEEAFATLGYPDEMRVCSRYYTPPEDIARGLGVGDYTADPFQATIELLQRLRVQMGVVTDSR